MYQAIIQTSLIQCPWTTKTILIPISGFVDATSEDAIEKDVYKRLFTIYKKKQNTPSVQSNTPPAHTPTNIIVGFANEKHN